MCWRSIRGRRKREKGGRSREGRDGDAVVCGERASLGHLDDLLALWICRLGRDVSCFSSPILDIGKSALDEVLAVLLVLRPMLVLMLCARSERVSKTRRSEGGLLLREVPS